MKRRTQRRFSCERAGSVSAGHCKEAADHGEETAGRLVAIGDTEEEIPHIPALAAVPHTTMDSVRSSNSSLARFESSRDTPVSAPKSRLSAGGGG